MNSNFILSGFADEIAQELDIQIRVIKKLSMHHIEMRGVDGNNLIYHNDAKVKEIKRKLDAEGIYLSSLGSPLGKIGITDPFAPHMEEFKRAVEVAHMMETKNIRMFSFYVPEKEREAYKSEVIDRLGQFVDYAAANDVVLCHENEKGIYGEMAAECKILMDQFYGEHFKAIFDFANFVQAKQNTLEAYDLLKPYLVYIHVKDAKWENGSVVPAGYGDGHVKEILKMLSDSGFAGYLSLEPHLSDFTGFAGLERNERFAKYREGERLNGEDAFTLAHSSLVHLLEEI